MLRTATPVPNLPEPAVTRYAQLQDLAALVGQPIGESGWFIDRLPDGGAQLCIEATVEREGGSKPVCVAHMCTRLHA